MFARPTLAFLLVFVSSVWSQEAVAPLPSCDTNLATQLVRQQVRESSTITANDKQIRILIRSADFLWKYDEPAAREYYADAFKRAEEEYKETGGRPKPRPGINPGFVEPSPDHRMDVIRSVASRDPSWAMQLIDRVIAEYRKKLEESTSQFSERELNALIDIAISVSATDRELARNIVRRVMQFPLTLMMAAAFSSIAAIDKELADSLYIEAVTRYRDERPRRLLFLTPYPFAEGRMKGIDKFVFGFSNPAGLQPNKALQRLFIEAFIARTAKFASSQADLALPAEKPFKAEPIYLVTGLNDLENTVISDFPDLLDRFTNARSQAMALLDAEMRKTMESSSSYVQQLEMTIDERINAAIKADKDGTLTDEMIVRLITWGEPTEKQFVKILPLIDKIRDESARKQAAPFYWFKRGDLAASEERFGDAEKYAELTGDAELKALVYFKMADKAAGSSADPSAKFEVLNKLSKVIRNVPDNVTKAQMLLGLSGKYNDLNHTIALDELSESIKVVNKLKDPDLTTSNVVRQIILENSAVFAMYSIPGYNMEKVFGELGKRDLDMALAHARSFDDRFFRTLAVIAIAKQCIAAPKPQPAK
jgi:hypothetical protein